MEGGSAPGPANFGSLDPSIVNGDSSPSPMSDVPIAGPPPDGSQNPPAPGPAATGLPRQPSSVPPPNPPMQPVSELNSPGEAILLTEMQELKAAYKVIHQLAIIALAGLFAIGLALAIYLSKKINAKYLPGSPAGPVVAA